jgi:coenzyme PQQ precursor peptide PqqA
MQLFASIRGPKSLAGSRFVQNIFLLGTIDFRAGVGYTYTTFGTQCRSNWGKIIMQWTAPAFEEVCLNCEINSYASAKL